MRIRKNAKLTELLFPHIPAGEKPPAYECKLNQSPWDVMNFSYQELGNPTSPRLQSHGDDSLTANGSLGDSICVVESVASMEKPDFMIIDDDEEADEREKFAGGKDDPILIDSELGLKSKDKRSCQCKKKTDGFSLLKSCGNTAGSSVKRADKAPTRRGRARTTTKRSTAASNPYEFYYYSGFGPSWGKRRGEKAGDASKTHLKNTPPLPPLPPRPRPRPASAPAGAIITTTSKSSSRTNQTKPSSSSSSSSQFDAKRGFDYMDDDDEDDDDVVVNGNTRKKRMRKPVKARSLKSLM